MSKFRSYSKNYNIDGHPITCNGVLLNKDQIIERLNSLEEQRYYLDEVMTEIGRLAGVAVGDVPALLDWAKRNAADKVSP